MASSLAETSRRPSGENASAVIDERCAGMRPISCAKPRPRAGSPARARQARTDIDARGEDPAIRRERQSFEMVIGPVEAAKLAARGDIQQEDQAVAGAAGRHELAVGRIGELGAGRLEPVDRPLVGSSIRRVSFALGTSQNRTQSPPTVATDFPSGANRSA